MPPTPPTALERAGSFLATSAAQIGLLARLVPQNLVEERARILAGWRDGVRESPRFCYAPADVESLRIELARFSEHPALGDLPLGEALRERAREIALEAEMVVFRGTKTFARLAEERFSLFTDDLRARSLALAKSWLHRTPHVEIDPVAVDDEKHPRSLVSRLREDVAARRLPFRIEVSPALSALAATGHDAVFVAAGRVADHETTERTLVHEIEGHVLPRVRAASTEHPLFRIGSARGTCDQEGYALCIEERHEYLNARRKRELALRHCIAEDMRSGATFADAVSFAADYGETLETAVRLAERAYRGGNGTNAGLGREVVYLASYLRVNEHLARDPGAEHVLHSGQVRCEWLASARAWL